MQWAELSYCTRKIHTKHANKNTCLITPKLEMDKMRPTESMRFSGKVTGKGNHNDIGRQQFRFTYVNCSDILDSTIVRDRSSQNKGSHHECRGYPDVYMWRKGHIV